jgi:hypothetical protein
MLVPSVRRTDTWRVGAEELEDPDALPDVEGIAHADSSDTAQAAEKRTGDSEDRKLLLMEAPRPEGAAAAIRDSVDGQLGTRTRQPLNEVGA